MRSAKNESRLQRLYGPIVIYCQRTLPLKLQVKLNFQRRASQFSFNVEFGACELELDPNLCSALVSVLTMRASPLFVVPLFALCVH